MGNNKVNAKKAVMIGCGFVGSSTAFALMQKGLFSSDRLYKKETDR